MPSPRPTPDPEGRGSHRELVTEPSLGRPIASHIQSDIIWPRFPVTKIRQRKFRMLLQSSKNNRGEGQKMDHKRIFVTQSQGGKSGLGSTRESRRGLSSPPRKGSPELPAKHAPTGLSRSSPLSGSAGSAHGQREGGWALSGAQHCSAPQEHLVSSHVQRVRGSQILLHQN